MKVFDEPGARLAQSRFAPHIVQAQHQVHFVVGNLGHCRSSLR
jgi:hypothetical protein